MNDADEFLRPRLQRLADDLVPEDSTVPAEAVLATYRRRRRARAGMLAVVAAIVVVAAGVPTLVTTLSSGPSSPPAASTSSVTGSPTAAPATPAVAAREAVEQVAAAITRPYRLTAPARFGTCPNLGPALSQALGRQMAFWQGSLPRGPEGCQYGAVENGDTGFTYAPRFWVNIGFFQGTTAEQMQRGVDDPGSLCVAVHVAVTVPPGAVDRCTQPIGQVEYHLYVPDSRRAGIWILSVASDSDYSGTTSARAIVAVADAAQGVFGG